MPLPTLAKTWQFAINRAVAAQGTVYKTKMSTMNDIKNALIGFGTLPWQLRYSCDARLDTGAVNAGSAGAAGDLVDRWTSLASFVGADGLGLPTAIRFPWTVLRQTGMATNFELCISNNFAVANGIMTFVVSPSAGFTGGSAAARPTATDEIVIISSANAHSGVDTAHKNHVWQSTDGTCTHVQTWRGSTNQCLLMMLQVPQNPVTGWTNPSVSVATGVVAGIAGTMGVLGAQTNRARTTGTIALGMTGECEVGSTQLLNVTTDVGTVPNDLNAEWGFYGIGLVSRTTGSKGRHGSVFDTWWAPIGTADADTFPNNAAARQFVKLGNLILPWTGDATIPLIV